MANDDGKVVRTDEEWREQLSEEEFQVARCSGTERAFTGRSWNEKAAGTYHCVCCGAPLFRSEAKYDSGTGWSGRNRCVRSATLTSDTSSQTARRRPDFVTA